MDATTPEEFPDKVFENEVRKETARREEQAAALRHQRDMEIAAAQHTRDMQFMRAILGSIAAVALGGLLFLYLGKDPESKNLADRFIVPTITALLGLLGGRFGKPNPVARS